MIESKTHSYVSPRFFVVFLTVSLATIILVDGWEILWLFWALQIALTSIATRSGHVIRVALALSLPFTIPLLIIHGILNPEYAETYSVFEFMPIRSQGLEFAATIGGRLAVVSAVGISAASVRMLDGIRLAIQLGCPRSIVLSFAMSLSLLKEVRRRAGGAYEAQQSRGMPVRSSVIRRALTLPTLVIPIVVSSIVDGFQRARLLEVRGLGSRFMLRDNEIPKETAFLTRLKILNPREVCVDIGDTVAWSGPVGSGKSRLAFLLCLGDASDEIVRHYSGDSPIDDFRVMIENISLIPTDCRNLLSGITDSVEEEIMLLASNYTIDSSRNELLNELIEMFSLERLRYQHPFSLSGGEIVRLAFAVAFSKVPRFLIVDQALDYVDTCELKSMARIISKRTNLRQLGVCHFKNRRVNQLEYKKVIDLLPRSSESPDRDRFMPESRFLKEREALIAENITYSYESGFSIRSVNLKLHFGEVLHIIGYNGSGKTTLLKSLAMLLEPHGEIRAFNPSSYKLEYPPPKRRIHEWAARVGYLYQNPNDQIFCSTVRKEVALNSQSDEAVDLALNALDLVKLEDSNPFELPLPLKRVVTIASLFARKPPVLLLDEPTAFLDESQCDLFTQAISGYVEAGYAVILVSHDDHVCRNLATRHMTMTSGRIN